jgi:hypothetical protein
MGLNNVFLSGDPSLHPDFELALRTGVRHGYKSSSAFLRIFLDAEVTTLLSEPLPGADEPHRRSVNSALERRTALRMEGEQQR